MSDDPVGRSAAPASGVARADSPGPHPAESDEKGHGAKPSHGAAGGLVLAALGIVFGDIGTSPLYALQTVFSINDGAVQPTIGDVYGVISMIVWSITLIVSIKY